MELIATAASVAFCTHRPSLAPSSLCLSQGSSMPKSLGMKDSSWLQKTPLTARTRRGWIPVTSTGMREFWGAGSAKIANASYTISTPILTSTPTTGGNP
jgi:hypothetical protein